jgi:hypothetical protein
MQDRVAVEVTIITDLMLHQCQLFPFSVIRLALWCAALKLVPLFLYVILTNILWHLLANIQTAYTVLSR